MMDDVDQKQEEKKTSRHLFISHKHRLLIQSAAEVEEQLWCL